MVMLNLMTLPTLLPEMQQTWLSWILGALLFSPVIALYLAVSCMMLLKVIGFDNSNERDNKALTPRVYLDKVLRRIPGYDKCPICRDALDDPEEIRACGHVFCSSCIRRTLANSDLCPLDRQPVSLPQSATNDADARLEAWKKSDKASAMLCMTFATIFAAFGIVYGNILRLFVNQASENWKRHLALVFIHLPRSFALAVIMTVLLGILDDLLALVMNHGVKVLSKITWVAEHFDMICLLLWLWAIMIQAFVPEAVDLIMTWEVFTIGIPLMVLFGVNRWTEYQLFPNVKWSRQEYRFYA